ncbi:MAG: hypothetical protein QNJ73_03115 [Gammaproteobacteria bacterium]|nr:hypothetical protein [Gammaproteobacteria bacterium]
MSLRVPAFLATVSLFAASAVNAITLDFSEFDISEDVGTGLTLPDATITAFDGSIQVRQFNQQSFCFITMDGCTGAGSLAFTQPVVNLTLDVFGVAPGETATIEILGSVGLLDTVTVTEDGVVDLSSYGVITELVIDAADFASGSAYRDITFEIVPIPAALPLMLSALLGSGWFFARRR